jgi:hypothetical protein
MVFIGNIRNGSYGLAFKKWWNNELRMKQIQFVESRTTGKAKGNPQYPVARRKLLESEIIAGCDVLCNRTIGMIKKKFVLAASFDESFD